MSEINHEDHDVNHVEAVGTVKGAPQYFGTKPKVSVFKFNLVTTIGYANKDGSRGEKKTTIFVTTFGDLADGLERGPNIIEGARVKLSGYISNNSYVSGKTGQRVYETVVIAREVDVIAEAPILGGPPIDDKDVPF